MRPEQLGLSLLTAHPIRFHQGGLAAKKERSICSSLRQQGDDPRTTGWPGFQHQFEHRFRPHRSYKLRRRGLRPGFAFTILRVSLVSRYSPLGEETLFLTSAPTSRSLMEKQTSKGSSVSGVTLIAPDDARMRNDKFHHIISATPLIWSGTSQSTKRQAPTWLSPWLT